MTTTHSAATSLNSVIGWTAAIAVVWLITAFLRPETTLHLGPVIVPLLPAVLLRGQSVAPRAVLAGVGISAATIAILFLTGNLNGPPFEPFDSVLTESIVVLAGSAIVGLLIARTGPGH